MDFVWDKTKAASNFKKHHIDFAEAIAVLEDESAITIEDRGHNEDRYVTLGIDVYGRLLVVVYAYQEPNSIRIISARKANKIEARFYQDKR